MFTTLCFVLSTAFATPVDLSDFAPSPGMGEPGGGGRERPGDGERLMKHFSKISDRLALSAEQKAAIEKLYFDNKSAGIDLKARSEKARLELERLMHADAVDEKAALKAFDAAADAEVEVRRNDLKLMLGIRKTLTADQWKQLDAMRDEARDQRRERKAGGPEGGPGGPGGPPEE